MIKIRIIKINQGAANLNESILPIVIYLELYNSK